MDARDGLEPRPDFWREIFQCFNEYYGLLIGVLFHKEFMSFFQLIWTWLAFFQANTRRNCQSVAEHETQRMGQPIARKSSQGEAWMSVATCWAHSVQHPGLHQMNGKGPCCKGISAIAASGDSTHELCVVYAQSNLDLLSETRKALVYAIDYIAQFSLQWQSPKF